MNSYTVENGSIVGRNGQYYNNRPLYGDHRPSYVLAGDRPHVRLARIPFVYGCFTLAVWRGDRAYWLHESAERISRYRPGRMEWEIRDPAFEGLTINLEVIPLQGADGFSAKLKHQGATFGDRLIWSFGGATPCHNVPNAFDPVVLDQHSNDFNRISPVLSKCFLPADCAGNRIRIESGRFLLTPPGEPIHTVAGRCTAGTLRIADAAGWANPSDLAANSANEFPIVCGLIDLKDTHAIEWIVEAFSATPDFAVNVDVPQEAFNRAAARVEKIAARIVLETPEPRLDTGVAAACYAMNSVYYPPVYVHGAMAWNVPFPGWRSMYGATAFGWHDNVKAEAHHYIASQNCETTARSAHADPEKLLCIEAGDSRFHGRGRITRDAHMYNFQTQFFDQLIHAWRWTGDAELEALLREALALHLEWARECFDPDDDGLYESYINSWPTDSVWYNGGGSAEESSYAYAGHRAAAEMARRAGDERSATEHESRLHKIRQALMAELWLPSKGYVAQYKEQGGLQRIHEDSWLCSIFLPIESGLLKPQEAIQALHYTEWGLERVKMPYGGTRCWTSNWVPSMWSVRELFPGDNYALALAYFHTGLAAEGWDILKGNFLESMYYGVVPGALACANGGTDFSDVLSMFCRTVVEGLFGYRPDYPNGIVHLAPQFPPSWDHASITTPDISIRFREAKEVQQWTITIQKPSRLSLRLPVRAKEIKSVEVDGHAAQWTTEAGFGCTVLCMDTAVCTSAEVAIKLAGCIASHSESLQLEVEVGKPVVLDTGSDPVQEIQDPQGVLTDVRIEKGRVIAKAGHNSGHHLVVAHVLVGKLPQWRVFKIQVKDARIAALDAARIVSKVPPNTSWDCRDLRAQLNGDIRTIYQQKYLSPRPATCSVRIGSDGYSPWTFPFWGMKAPTIDLANVPQFLDTHGTLQTPQGVPFTWPGEDRNIAFVSLWDNWPREVSFPVGQQGEAIWFLLCGTTNPMQCRIANARLRLSYADGITEDVDIIPPLNFWTLCPLGIRDYEYQRDGFALPATPPPLVQLGNNCRGVLLNARLRQGVELKQVTLEALSQEIVIGVMAMSIMNPGG